MTSLPILSHWPKLLHGSVELTELSMLRGRCGTSAWSLSRHYLRRSAHQGQGTRSAPSPRGEPYGDRPWCVDPTVAPTRRVNGTGQPGLARARGTREPRLAREAPPASHRAGGAGRVTSRRPEDMPTVAPLLLGAEAPGYRAGVGRSRR